MTNTFTAAYTGYDTWKFTDDSQRRITVFQSYLNNGYAMGKRQGTDGLSNKEPRIQENPVQSPNR